MATSRSTPVSVPNTQESVEVVVCKTDEIGNNEMKRFDFVGETQVLLVNQDGKLSALGAKCTHYGAPLNSGILSNGQIRCPWHGACFNATTGDIEDYPGLDSLPCYEVFTKENNIIVRANSQEVDKTKRVKAMSKGGCKANGRYVIIGGGVAAATCAETLRQHGFEGTIEMITRENHLPYDRVKCSKTWNADINSIQFRNEEFYSEHIIDVVRNTEVTAIDTTDHKIICADKNKEIKYNKCFIATGANPLKPKIEGVDLKNVITLRSYEDSLNIGKLLSLEKSVVILGNSFIALEAAATSVDKAKQVTVIARSDVPFKKLFGSRIGETIKKLLIEKGVNYIGNSGIQKFKGQEELESVELINGDTLEAHVCILGTGNSLNTKLLKDAGVPLREDGSVEVDKFMCTSVNGLYAGGDIAHAPLHSYGGTKATIGHFALSQMHGRVAALNMLGKKVELRTVPFFWTMLFGKSIRYAGYGDFDDILHVGDVENFKFVAYYLRGDEIVAIAACGMDPYPAKYATLRGEGRILKRSDLNKELLF